METLINMAKNNNKNKEKGEDEDEVLDLIPDMIEVKPIDEVIVKDQDVAQPIQSPNFKQNTTGWKLGSNGLLEANGAKMSTVGSGSFTTVDGKTVSYVDGIITAVV